MIEKEFNSFDFNRRDFLKSGSAAAFATMLGGMPLFAETNQPSASPLKPSIRVKSAVVGCGAGGRAILYPLARVEPDLRAEIPAICDNYPTAIKRAAKDFAPKAAQTDDYKTILADK